MECRVWSRGYGPDSALKGKILRNDNASTALKCRAIGYSHEKAKRDEVGIFKFKNNHGILDIHTKKQNAPEANNI